MTWKTIFLSSCAEGSATIRGADTISVEVRRCVGGRELIWRARFPDAPDDQPPDSVYFQAQIQDFVNSIRTGRSVKAGGGTAVRVLNIMNDCYGMATRMDQKWMDFVPAPVGALL